jgi:hypothetical protein
MVKINSTANNNCEWPSKSGDLCHHCAHGFTTIPVLLPHVDKNGFITLTGNFCSFNCGRSWLLERTKNRKENLCTFHILARRLIGPSTIQAAPSKEILKAFGGTMSIEEYRKGFAILTTWDCNFKHMQFKHLKTQHTEKKPYWKLDFITKPITGKPRYNIMKLLQSS